MPSIVTADYCDDVRTITSSLLPLIHTGLNVTNAPTIAWKSQAQIENEITGGYSLNQAAEGLKTIVQTIY